MTWCVAVGCNSNSFTKNRKKGLKFFRLPKDDNLKKKWLQNIKRENLSFANWILKNTVSKET